MFYTLISSIMRGLLVLSIFVEFKFTSLNKKIRTIFFRPMGSKKITKEAQMTQHMQNPLTKRCTKMQRSGS